MLFRIPESLASGSTTSKRELELKPRDSLEVCDETIATSGYFIRPSSNQYVGSWCVGASSLNKLNNVWGKQRQVTLSHLWTKCRRLYCVYRTIYKY